MFQEGRQALRQESEYLVDELRQLPNQDRDSTNDAICQAADKLHPCVNHKGQILYQRFGYEHHSLDHGRDQRGKHPAKAGCQRCHDFHRGPRQHGETAQNAVTQQGNYLDGRIDNQRRIVQKALAQCAE